MQFKGSLCYDSHRANNKRYYQSVLDSNKGTPKFLLSAKRYLALVDRFSHSEELVRIKSHIVEVFEYKNLEWQLNRKTLVPFGELEKIFEFYSIVEIPKACEFDNSLNEVIEEVEIDKEDGTKIIGQRVRTSLFSGPPERKILSLDYLNIEFDPTIFLDHGQYSYGFDILSYDLKQKKDFEAFCPVQYLITEQTFFNNVLIEQNKRRFVPKFYQKDGSKTLNRKSQFKGYSTKKIKIQNDQSLFARLKL